MTLISDSNINDHSACEEGEALPNIDGDEGKIGKGGRRKRKITPEKISRKKKKSAGETYVSTVGKIVPQRQVGPPCTAACKNKCSINFTDDTRQTIFDNYWKLSEIQKKEFILKYVQKCKKKRSTTGKESRTNYIRKYYLPIESEVFRVCRAFFMSTLDVKSKFLRYTEDSSIALNSAKKDARGCKTSKNKTTPQQLNTLRKFIESLPAVDSHYCRSSTEKKYLAESWESVTNIHRVYKLHCVEHKKIPLSLWVFKKIFQEEYNIGIHSPKKDKCDVCVKFANLNCPTQQEIELNNAHKAEKEAINKKYADDQKRSKQPDNNFVTCSFDLQKVLETPHGKSILFYYSRKYAMYNSTFYESGSRNVMCYMWGETDGNRGCNEIISIVKEYLITLDEKKMEEVSLYCDNCPGQQKNKPMFLMLSEFVAKSKYIKKITLNFLMAGHSLMTVDSAHAVIERAARKKTIYAPSEWITVVGNARFEPFPYEVKKKIFSDFFDWRTYADSRNFKYDDKHDFKVSETRIAIFEKKSGECFKILTSALEGEESYKRVSISSKRKRKGGVSDLKPAYGSKLMISEAKYRDLMKLCEKGAIPGHFKEEYVAMPYCTQMRDCLNEPDDDEFED